MTSMLPNLEIITSKSYFIWPPMVQYSRQFSLPQHSFFLWSSVNVFLHVHTIRDHLQEIEITVVHERQKNIMQEIIFCPNDWRGWIFGRKLPEQFYWAAKIRTLDNLKVSLGFLSLGICVLAIIHKYSYHSLSFWSQKAPGINFQLSLSLILYYQSTKKQSNLIPK
jgi:hypothetical protein